MNTTVIFKTDKELKNAAQKTARQMGVPFSAVLNEMMRQFVAHQEITFTSNKPLVPTKYLTKILKDADNDLAANINITKHTNTGSVFADIL